MKEVWRTKDPADRAQKLADVNADSNTAELRKIYGKVLENIKTFCPNLLDELSYKEWDNATKERVQKWIDIVLSCNDPRTSEEAPAVLTEDTTTATSTVSIQADPVIPAANDADDLPF